jgi:FkbM family methyltransferase
VPTDDITMVPSLEAGDYERFELDVFETLIDAGSVVFDVGGNMGVYALIAARLVGPGGHVYSFEPIPANLTMFERNLGLSKFPDNVTVLPKAVGPSQGTVAIGFDKSNIGTHSVAHGDENGAIEVDLISLDAFACEIGVTPDLIKIDVEGFEPAVLDGASGLLSARPTLMMEFTPRLIRGCGFVPERCAERLLEVYGLAYLMDDRRLGFIAYDTASSLMSAVARSTSVNLLFVSDERHAKRLGSLLPVR